MDEKELHGYFRARNIRRSSSANLSALNGNFGQRQRIPEMALCASMETGRIMGPRVPSLTSSSLEGRRDAGVSNSFERRVCPATELRNGFTTNDQSTTPILHPNTSSNVSRKSEIQGTNYKNNNINLIKNPAVVKPTVRSCFSEHGGATPGKKISSFNPETKWPAWEFTDDEDEEDSDYEAENPNPSSSKEEEVTNSTCTICQDKSIEIMFLPCGHASICRDCYSQYSDMERKKRASAAYLSNQEVSNEGVSCPLCRKKIENFAGIWIHGTKCKLCGCSTLDAVAGGADGCGCLLGCYDKAIELLNKGGNCPYCSQKLVKIIKTYVGGAGK